MPKFVRTAVIPLLAGLIGFLLSGTVVAYLEQPNVTVLATYGRLMPWEGFLTTEASPFHERLRTVFDSWKSLPGQLSPDVTDGLGIQQFENLQWDDPSWVAVEEARSGFGAESSLFQDENDLEKTLAASYAVSSTQPSADENVLRVTATPERSAVEERKRIDALCRALTTKFTSLYPNNVPQVKAVYYSDYKDVLKGLAKGQVDLALCSPFSSYTCRRGLNIFDDRNGTEKERLIRLAQGRKTPLGGYSVVLIKSKGGAPFPEHVQDYTFIYASKISTSGYLIPLRMLNGLGVHLDPRDNRRAFYPFHLRISETGLGNHDAVIDKVQTGLNLIAGVPSDKLDPRMATVRRISWWGAAIGALVGMVVATFALYARRKPQK